MSHRFRTKQPNAADARRRREYASREHRETRKAWQARIDSGVPVPCSRKLPGCTGIHPGVTWHLDHEDNRVGYRGPSCVSCNLKAAARKGNRVQRVKRRTVVARAVARRSLLG